MNPERLEEILSGFSGKRVLVIGDLMLDHYLWGNIQRISPEAPVPVVEVQSKRIDPVVLPMSFTISTQSGRRYSRWAL